MILLRPTCSGIIKFIATVKPRQGKKKIAAVPVKSQTLIKG